MRGAGLIRFRLLLLLTLVPFFSMFIALFSGYINFMWRSCKGCLVGFILFLIPAGFLLFGKMELLSAVLPEDLIIENSFLNGLVGFLFMCAVTSLYSLILLALHVLNMRLIRPDDFKAFMAKREKNEEKTEFDMQQK